MKRQNQAEAELLQAQKVEALGQMTGGVAHDFNNLLTVLQGCLEILSGKQRNEQLQGRVDMALRTVERGERLTAQLLAFARRQPLARTTIDLNAQLRRMTQLLVRTVGNGIAIHTDLAPDLWLVDADATQLELAVINLAINAGDAMPGGGELGIRTFNRAVSHESALEQPHESALEQPHESVLEQPTKVGDFVGLEISDTGHGMPPEAVARAFEPFFTTKEAGKGTGLGLSMVYGFARQLGGFASIRSEIGRGTAVTLVLPRGFPASEADDGAVSTDLPRGAST
jgi:signal transduction histidine kinase